jgi:HK97 family phage portal protein
MPLPARTPRSSSQLAERTARPVRGGVRERSHSEETITVDNAVTVSGVIAIITLISQDTASLPLIYYGKRGRSRFRAYDSPYYSLMHNSPNPEHTAMQFREFVASHVIAWGDFYAQVITDDAGVARQLWPLRPDRMTVKRFEGERVYIYQTSEGKERVFLRDEILHIPGFGFNGLNGMSRIALARHAVGLAMSQEKFGSKFFANDASVGVVYKHPGELSDDAYNHLTESLSERKGVDASHNPIILEEGMSLERLGLPNDDSQYLESRQFQLAEINRILGPVPPHMIGDIEKSTSWGTGIDSQEQGYVNHTLRPYAVRIEQGLWLQLLLEEERQAGYFFEHLFDAFLRGDIATRYAAYQIGITNGFISRNEVRARENLNPRKGLDALVMPLNMATIKDSGADGSGESTDTEAANALVPLWQDAIARVVKREANDVLGASRRWQAKGDQEKFAEWVNNFYNGTHAVFMQKQFKPLIEVTTRLWGVDHTAKINEFIFEFLGERCQQVLGMSAEQVMANMDPWIARSNVDTYIAETAEKIMALVLEQETLTRAGDDVEDDYDW